jgi:four helix bundle protein
VPDVASARRFEDLIAWQLAEELRERIIAVTERDRVRRDFAFCDDARRAARSAPANIAEGFGWYEPRPNSRHVSIAKASLEETKNHILDAFKRRYVDAPEREELLSLTRRALGATRRYLLDLKSCKSAPRPKPYPTTKANPERQEPRNPGTLEPWNRNDWNPGTCGTPEPAAHYSISIAPGSSTSCLTRTRNCTASAPSTMRWS